MIKPELLYTSDAPLKARQDVHANFTIGRPLEDLVDEALKLTREQSLLDIGTAFGAFPIRLRQQGHHGRLVGLDFSSGMIEKAKSFNTDVEFLEGDAMNLPFANHSFDVVTARHMLYHVADINQALLEVRRVLKPNGTFLALTNADGYMADYWAVIEKTLSGNNIFASFLEEHLNAKYYHLHLLEKIQAVFPNAELTIKDQFLEFPNSAPAVAYWHSMQAGSQIPDESWAEATTQLEAAFAKQVPWKIWKGIASLKAHSSKLIAPNATN